MRGTRILVAFGILCGLTTFLPGIGSPALARTEITPDPETRAPQKVIDEIHSTFEEAEKAIGAGDLDGLMKFYSNDYEYHGLKKEDIRKMWKDLFAKYRRIETKHFLSKFVTKGDGKAKTAEITCTGNLWATSRESGKRESIDSWFEEVHYLVFEDGMWRVRGNAGKATHSFQFGTAPHPLF